MARGDDLLVIIQPVDVEMVVSVDYSGLDLLIDDFIVMTDELVVGIDYNLVVDDAVVLDDAFATETVLGVTFNEFILIADDLLFEGEFSLTFNDGLLVSDSPSLDPGGRIDTSDDLTVTDGPVTFVVTKPFADAVALTDDVVFGKVSDLLFNDSVVVTDAFAKAVDLTFADAVTLTEQLLSGDSAWGNVSILLHGDGPNNGTNRTFRDSTANNDTVSMTGTPTQGSPSPYANDPGAGGFDGSSYVSLPASGRWSLTGDFTAEAWVMITADSAVDTDGFRIAAVMGANKQPTAQGWVLDIMGDGTTTGTAIRLVAWNAGSLVAAFTAPTAITKNVWHHIAVSRSGTTLRAFLDGTLVGTDTLASNISANETMRVGAFAWSGYMRGLIGFISDARYSGVARYTAAFTPPTNRMQSDGNTALLLSFNNAAARDETRKRNWSTPGASKTSTTQSKFGGASLSFSGATADIMQTPYTPDLVFGASPYTIECWFYSSNLTGILVSNQPVSSTGSDTAWRLGFNASKLYFASWNVTLLDIPTTITATQWTHVEISFDGTTTRAFINGALAASTSVVTNFSQVSGVSVGGCNNTSAPQPYTGYIDDLRVTKGVARHTASFTPPTQAYPEGPSGPVTVTQNLICLPDAMTMTDSAPVWSKVHILTINDTVTMADTSFINQDPFWGSVSLLFHAEGADGQQNNTFLDTASWRVADFTPTGNVLQGAVSPYVGKGGSGYFDGSSYLSYPADIFMDMGSGDFTLEAWVRPNNAFLAGGQFIMDHWPVFSPSQLVGQWQFFIDANGKLAFYISTSNTATVNITSVATLQSNVWQHVAVVRSGTAVRLYINGVQDAATLTHAGQIGRTDTLLRMCARSSSSATEKFVGYVSDLRASKVARYTASFTPPVAPHVNDPDTLILASFTNAGIVDSAQITNFRTVGNVQITTAQSKFGGGSIVFDGSGDMLTSPFPIPVMSFGTSDWTVEFFARLRTTSPTRLILDTRSAQNQPVFTCYMDSGNIVFMVSGSGRLSTGALNVNQWYHVAVCRQGSSTRLFLDGVQIGSAYVDTVNYTVGNTLMFGDSPWSSGTYFDGWLDEFRVTAGVARYTANFSPPTGPFPNAGQMALFDRLDKNPGVDLTNNGYTVKHNGSGANDLRGVRSRRGVTTDKYYWEVKVDVAAANGTIGMATKQFNLTSTVATPDHIGIGGVAHTVGDIHSFAVDMTAGRYWYRKNGGAWNGDPVAGTGGLTVMADGATTLLAAAKPFYLLNHCGLGTYSYNIGQSTYAFTPPAGFGNFPSD